MIEYVEEQELDRVDQEELPEGVRCFIINRRYTIFVGHGTQGGRHFQNIIINPPPVEKHLPLEIWNYFRSDVRQGSPTGMLDGNTLKLWTEGMTPR